MSFHDTTKSATATPTLHQRVRKLMHFPPAWTLLGVAFFVTSTAVLNWHEPGALTRAHAPWKANCAACHTPFNSLGRGSGATSDRGAAVLQRCTVCHDDVGPHRASELPHSTPGCTNCHREHRGREFSMTRVDDRNCTSCHGTIVAHMKPDAGPARCLNISDFDRDEGHPNFKLFRDKPSVRDPRSLKFNHSLHMTPGIVMYPGSQPFMLAQIPDEQARARYVETQQGVTLDCSACHESEVSSDGVASVTLTTVSTRQSAGAHMLPIHYERHCSACHPLSFDPELPNLSVPHRLQPQAVRDFLETVYVHQYVSGHPGLLAGPISRRKMPGKLEEELQAREYVATRIQQAEKLFYSGKTTCMECHFAKAESGHRTPTQIEATNIPGVWFEHAAFSHAAHRFAACRECHPGAYADARTPPGLSIPWRSSDDVLIPEIGVCRRCHTASGRSPGATAAAAPSHCTQCHRYHDTR